jgi:hypothetical protein
MNFGYILPPGYTSSKSTLLVYPVKRPGYHQSSQRDNSNTDFADCANICSNRLKASSLVSFYGGPDTDLEQTFGNRQLCYGLFRSSWVKGWHTMYSDSRAKKNEKLNFQI